MTTFALLSPTGRVDVLAPSAPDPVPPGQTWVDVSATTPAPAIGWTTADGGKTFADPYALSLPQQQAATTANLRAACQAAIEDGFTSAALGAPHTYPSDDVSQRNLLAAASVNASATPSWTANLWCADANGTWSMAAHTPAQVQQANLDWIAFRQGLQAKLEPLLAAVAAATTTAAAQAVSW